MRPLSPMQRKVFERLLEHRKRTGALPDLQALAKSLNIHYVSLRQHLRALADKGYLHFESRGRGQSPRLELPAAFTGIPVLGEIPAGPLSEALAEPEGYLKLEHALADFVLRVRGDSMADLIQDGDLVLLAKGAPWRHGEICAVRVGGDEVTLKYVEYAGESTLTLRAHNPAYAPLTVAAEEVAIEGCYRGLLRGEVAGALLFDA